MKFAVVTEYTNTKETMDLLKHLEDSRSFLFCCGVYGIVCIHNSEQKLYVGSSVNIYYRLRDHIKQLRVKKHYNKILQSLWNKESEEKFYFLILERCTPEKRIDFEKECQQLNNNINLITPGVIPQHSNGLKGRNYLDIYGTENPTNGFKVGNQNISKRPEVRKLLSERTTQQWKQGRGKSYPKNEETRRKMSEARKLYWEKKKCEQQKDTMTSVMGTESTVMKTNVHTYTGTMEE